MSFIMFHEPFQGVSLRIFVRWFIIEYITTVYKKIDFGAVSHIFGLHVGSLRTPRSILLVPTKSESQLSKATGWVDRHQQIVEVP